MKPLAVILSVLLIAGLAACGSMPTGYSSTRASASGPNASSARTGKAAVKSPVMIVKELQTRADQGDAEAQNTLAVAYREGQGVPQDWEQVYFWDSLAANSSEQVSDRAAISRNIAAEHLKPEQIAALDARVRAWRPLPKANPTVPTLEH